MPFLKQSTVATVAVGPILDSAGAEYAGAVIGDLTITKNGTSAAMAATATLTIIANGHYALAFTTGNTDTCGQVAIHCNKATYQMPPVHFDVVSAAVYDELFATGALGYIANAPVNLQGINGNTTGVAALDRTTRAIGLGTCGGGSSTISIITSSLVPAAVDVDQFKGRIVIFDKDTTTTQLRGQATDITGNNGSGVLAVTALTHAPVSGDTFSIS
jgi:hypothetical protein